VQTQKVPMFTERDMALRNGPPTFTPGLSGMCCVVWSALPSCHPCSRHCSRVHCWTPVFYVGSRSLMSHLSLTILYTRCCSCSPQLRWTYLVDSGPIRRCATELSCSVREQTLRPVSAEPLEVCLCLQASVPMA
jgi:hypothetical protein